MINEIRSFFRSNSPNVLSAAGCVGVVTTAYLAARAAHKAHEYDLYHITGPLTKPEFAKEYIKVAWKLYIPAGVSGALTIGSIIGANRIGNRRTIAAQALLAVSERAYTEYRRQVVDEYGDKKDQSFRDRVADKAVQDNPPPEILIAGSGDVLCCELLTGRYFPCSMERLKRAQNEINRKVLAHDYATLDDFYYEIGIERTYSSSEAGWTSGRLMELEFSSTIHNERPCLAFSYSYVKTL